MGSAVRELTAEEHARLDRLKTFNGFGFTMRSHTSKDPLGRQFATRWFTVFGLPLIPLERYLIEEVGADFSSYGIGSTFSERFLVHGVTSLHPLEVLGSYVWSWVIGPAFVVLPFIQSTYWFDNHDDGASTWWLLTMLAGVILWPVVSLVILVLLSQWRRNRVRPEPWV
ncbi:MAG TPA: hypothetical protein VIL36_06995 [Acidimicrobiales bacterium]